MKKIAIILIYFFAFSCSKNEVEKPINQQTAYLQYLKEWLNKTSKHTGYSVQDIQLLKKDSLNQYEIRGYITYYNMQLILKLDRQRNEKVSSLKKKGKPLTAEFVDDNIIPLGDSIKYYANLNDKIFAAPYDSVATAYYEYEILIKVLNRNNKKSKAENIMVFSPKNKSNTIIPSSDIEAHINTVYYK